MSLWCSACFVCNDLGIKGQVKYSVKMEQRVKGCKQALELSFKYKKMTHIKSSQE